MIGEKAYQNAMRRRAELRQELQEIETFLRLCEKFGEDGGKANAPNPFQAAIDTQGRTTPGGSPFADAVGIAGLELLPHIRKMILDVGRPMSRSAIVKGLGDLGIKVSGQDPATNLGTVMWRAKDQFINLRAHGYWPRDVVYAPAGYEPSADDEADEGRIPPPGRADSTDSESPSWEQAAKGA